MTTLSLQTITTAPTPKLESFQRWVGAVLDHMQQSDREVTIRLVDTEESAALNSSYRQKIGPTNILSFPFAEDSEIETDYLGDLVICAPLVISQAQEQHKALEAHWAHLVVHGCLHLLGYDHQTETDAETMESLEIKLLQQLQLPNPYEEI